VFSPSGRWLAFASNESGRYQVYVRPYPAGGSFQVSNDGGAEPVWSPDGRELFYRNGDSLLTVPVDGAQVDASAFGRPRELFTLRRPWTPGGGGRHYDIAPGGDRFVMTIPAADVVPSELCVVLNWTEELKRLAPTP